MSRRQNIAIAKHPVKGTGQLSQAELGLDYYVARWYDPMTGHFTQADSIIPEPGNVGNYDRYSYAQNNPIRFMDPYGHGIDCGVGESGCNKSSDLRKWKEFSQQKNLEERNEKILINIADSLNTPQYYITGWDNFSTAWTIFWNPNSSWFQKDIAAEYMQLWIIGNLALFVGVAGLSCAATGPACVKAVEGALGIATYVSADGNPTNEIQLINTGIYTVYQYVENGIAKYYGITNNFFRRAYQHSISRGWSIQPIHGLSNTLSKSDAKAVEQVLIEQAGIINLYNKINSIASTNPIYSDAIIRGMYILDTMEQIR